MNLKSYDVLIFFGLKPNVLSYIDQTLEVIKIEIKNYLFFFPEKIALLS